MYSNLSPNRANRQFAIYARGGDGGQHSFHVYHVQGFFLLEQHLSYSHSAKELGTRRIGKKLTFQGKHCMKHCSQSTLLSLILAAISF